MQYHTFSSPNSSCSKTYKVLSSFVTIPLNGESESVSHSVWLDYLQPPWTVACQSSLSMGILQARILEWVAIPFSRASLLPRNWTWVSHIAGRCFTVWATRDPCSPKQDLWISVEHLGEGNGTPLQYSCLENPMDRGAWWAVVHGVTKSRTWLSDFTFTYHLHALEKEMATHSSVLAWRIPGTEEPGGLLSMGSHRVGYDWSDLAAAVEHLTLLVRLPLFGLQLVSLQSVLTD